MDRILLSCGNGGVENASLINEVFMKYFSDFSPFGGEDSGIFGGIQDKNPTDSKQNICENGVKYAISVDSYTITPIFFNGGDIGKLSVCGSCNDVAMMGAKPKFITTSFMIEEGFLKSDLEKIAQSMANEIKKANLVLLSADTKVVPKGAVSGLFITTNVIGEIWRDNLSSKNLKDGDVIIQTAQIGDHGACIYCARNDIGLDSGLKSDCKNLWDMIEPLLAEDLEISAMRDATRGGIASVLNEWAKSSNCHIELVENDILISNEVRGVCEILGLEAYSLANEGVCVIALPRSKVARALEILQRSQSGKNARIIGEVKKCDNLTPKNQNKNADSAPKVVLVNSWGVRRYLDYPSGEILPRIC